ncbi:hypothetical protein HDU82_008942 [Entophlyctis luteolus]|nr:hypothetical protein HDU82_008942 [Entophlyctis luteolus]
MVLGARAHYIAHKILYNTPKSLVRRLAHVSPERRLEKLQGSLHSIISKLQHMLYPWLEESFSTALEMQASLPMDSIGIAMTCGNTHFYLAQHLILSLRNVFNVTIPIEVFYAGPSDLTVQKINVLNSMPGVEAVNLFNFFTNETLKGNGWSFKPFAILAARFRTVLFMDPDIAFLKNPMTILGSPLFRKNGLVYYRDRKVWHPERLELVGLFNAMNPHMSNYAFSGSFARSAEDGFQGTTEEMESGFIPVDKGNTGVLFSLLLAAKMNSKQERDTVFYKLAHGDKESFWFASESLRVIYAFNPSYSGSIGILGLKRDDKHTSVCVGKHLHSNEFQEPFWFHDGSVLIDYRQFGPPNFRFSELTHMALHYDFELEEQAWHDGINCLERPNEQTFPVEGEIANLLDHYRAMYRDEIVKVD